MRLVHFLRCLSVAGSLAAFISITRDLKAARRLAHIQLRWSVADTESTMKMDADFFGSET